MHTSSLYNMKVFRDSYLLGKQDLKIMDIGSLNLNGSYEELFTKWEYIGVDIVAGNNVDIVLEDPYKWQEIETDSVDVVISGSAFEHIEFFWLTMEEIVRILKPGGVCCIIAPSSGPMHHHPVDCWRFLPDGFRALARYVGLEVLEAKRPEEGRKLDWPSEMWADTVLIARKPM